LGHPVQRAEFEILSASEVARVQSLLALLEPMNLPGYRRNTVVVMRAGLLFQEGLYSEARKELLAAITADPKEPTLHFYLGRVYEKVGLKDLAAEAFDDAHFLSTPEP
jgi:predicted Zn-dependent protease